MKREILFIGKRIDDGQWVEGGYLQASGTSKMLIDRTSSNPAEWVYKDICIDSHLITVFTPPDTQGWDYGTQFKFYKVIPDTIGEFTGRKDKNDIKIFNGNLVLLDGCESPHTVTWHEDIACFFLDHDHEDAIGFGDVDSSDMEIVGNIHDKSEQ